MNLGRPFKAGTPGMNPTRRVATTEINSTGNAHVFLQPRSRGFPEGLLAQPFYGWGFVGGNRKARFSVLTLGALALVVFIVRYLFQTLNRCSLFVMFLLVSDVVYHPFQILCAETNDAIAGLPVQDFPIREFVIDVMRTRAFELSYPFTD
jgi:hypothetical protein